MKKKSLTRALVFGTAAAAIAIVQPALTSGAMASACSGGGPYVDVNINYGTPFHGTGSVFTTHNGTGSNATVAFVSTSSTTVTSTVSGSLQVSFSDLISSVKSEIGATVTKTQTVTSGVTTTETVGPHLYGHAQYGVYQKHLLLSQYDVNKACAEYNNVSLDAYLDDGAGWNLWTTTN